MSAPRWLTSSLADVPPGERWLGPREAARLARLTVPKRRADWRLGRWTAKTAAAAWLGVVPERVEVLAAPDGAPEAYLDGRDEPAALSLSLSHRAGRALAAVAEPDATVGCDLELVEPRSPAFVREWLTSSEQALVASASAPDRPLVANLVWTAKEAAAKVRREGLRLDVRRARCVAEDVRGGGASGAVEGPPEVSPSWRPLAVHWEAEALRTEGWWRAEPGWVMVIAGSVLPPERDPLQPR